MTELPEELRALGRGMSVVAREDLAERVLAGIAAHPPRPSRWRRWLAGLVAVVVAVALSALITSPVRAAIAHAFRFGGVEVRQESGPSPVPSPGLPGEHVTDLESASRQVGFPVRLPAALGTPDSVSVTDGRVVSLYYMRPTGPVRIDEFAGNLGVLWEKYAGSGIAQQATVNGQQALWFADPITIVYVGTDGAEIPDTARESSGTLLWLDGTLTFRLDGVRPLESALAVADSMR